MVPIFGGRICVRRLHSAGVMDRCTAPVIFVMSSLRLGRLQGDGIAFLIPLVNLVALWIFANARWPALDGADEGGRRI